MNSLSKKILFITFFSLEFAFCFAQDYNWWNEIHNWDGKTHWTRYIITSPKYMGPNALPVPEVKTGSWENSSNFKFAYEYHYSTGDKTNNLFTELLIPLYTDRAGLKLNIVPIEYYVVDTITRDIRSSRDYDGKGSANGDLYIGTYIQLLKDNKILPDILLTINLRTASGNNLIAARYTDTPGYYFDLSFGKDFLFNQSIIKSIRPYGMLGFYVWQTYLLNYYQDDAFLYGLGTDLEFSKFQISNGLGGYRGYLNNGDKPMVYRLTLRSKFNSLLNFELRYQQGITDFNYASFRFACTANFIHMKN